MEALKALIDSDVLEKIIFIPDNFKHKKLEIIVLPFDEDKNPTNAKDINEIIGNLKSLPVDPLKFQKDLRNEW